MTTDAAGRFGVYTVKIPNINNVLHDALAPPPVQGGGARPAGRLQRVPGRRRREADRDAGAPVATARRPRDRLHARLHRRALLRSLDRDPRSAGSEMLHARMSGHSYE